MSKIHIIYEWLLRTSPSMTQLSRASQNRCMLHNIVVPPNSWWLTQIYALMFDVHGTLPSSFKSQSVRSHNFTPQLAHGAFVCLGVPGEMKTSFSPRWHVTSCHLFGRLASLLEFFSHDSRDLQKSNCRTRQVTKDSGSKQVLKSCIFVSWSIYHICNPSLTTE